MRNVLIWWPKFTQEQSDCLEIKLLCDYFVTSCNKISSDCLFTSVLIHLPLPLRSGLKKNQNDFLFLLKTTTQVFLLIQYSANVMNGLPYSPAASLGFTSLLWKSSFSLRRRISDHFLWWRQNSVKLLASVYIFTATHVKHILTMMAFY